MKRSQDLSQYTDEELLSDFLSGDNRSALELFQRYNAKLTVYCAKLLKNKDAAQDIAQEIWEKIISLRTNEKKIYFVKAFLFTTARNLCLNHISFAGRHVEFSSVYSENTTASEETSHFGEVVVSALDRLDFEDRELLVLHFYCGYEFTEIATMLNISPNATWTRASRARAKLKTMIEKISQEEKNLVQVRQ